MTKFLPISSLSSKSLAFQRAKVLSDILSSSSNFSLIKNTNSSSVNSIKDSLKSTSLATSINLFILDGLPTFFAIIILF